MGDSEELDWPPENGPSAVVVDAQDRVFVARHTGAITVCDVKGVLLARWYASPDIRSPAAEIAGMAVRASDGAVFVSDAASRQVLGFRFSESDTEFANPDTFFKSDMSVYFTSPTAVACGPQGTVFVCNKDHVIELDTDGTCKREIGMGVLREATGVSVATDGRVYVADASRNNITVFDAAGAKLSQFGSSGTGEGEFSGCRGVLCTPGGDVVVSDYGNNRVQVFDQEGEFQLLTEDDGQDEFEHPWHLGVDSEGDVLVADETRATWFCFKGEESDAEDDSAGSGSEGEAGLAGTGSVVIEAEEDEPDFNFGDDDDAGSNDGGHDDELATLAQHAAMGTVDEAAFGADTSFGSATRYPPASPIQTPGTADSQDTGFGPTLMAGDPGTAAAGAGAGAGAGVGAGMAADYMTGGSGKPPLAGTAGSKAGKGKAKPKKGRRRRGTAEPELDLTKQNPTDADLYLPDAEDMKHTIEQLKKEVAAVKKQQAAAKKKEKAAEKRAKELRVKLAPHAAAVSAMHGAPMAQSSHPTFDGPLGADTPIPNYEDCTDDLFLEERVLELEILTKQLRKSRGRGSAVASIQEHQAEQEAKLWQAQQALAAVPRRERQSVDDAKRELRELARERGELELVLQNRRTEYARQEDEERASLREVRDKLAAVSDELGEVSARFERLRRREATEAAKRRALANTQASLQEQIRTLRRTTPRGT